METIATRPKRKDAHAEAAKKIAENLMSYSGHGLGDDVEAIIHDIKEALDSAGYPYDGFAIGKALDSEGWEVDASMIDNLDCAGDEVEEVLTAMITAWMEETKFQHPYKVGDPVKFVRMGTTISSKVHEIRMDGTVLIDYGHKHGCLVLQWEDVKLDEQAE